MPSTKPHTSQISVSDLASDRTPYSTMRTSAYDDRELNADLRWPLNIEAWETLRYDPQVHGLLQSIKLPIKRTARLLEGDDVSAEVMDAVRAELGLDADQAKGRRRPQGFGINFDVFLEEALTAFIFGHSVFEQVYVLEDSFAHIGALAYIHPKVIKDWHISRLGGLDGITVETWVKGRPGNAAIDINSLVVFSQDRLGANWWGTSLFRPLYKPWYLKDVAERVGAMAIERGAMGVPWIQYTENGTRQQAEQIGKNWRAGESSYVATRQGDYLIEILGARSAELVNPENFIDMMKRDMSKAWSAQVLDLGHAAGIGSGNASETFMDMFASGINALAVMFETTITDHIIRDFVQLNWGEDEPYPRFNFAPITPTIAGEVLAGLVNAGLVTPDEDVERALRDRYGLPALAEGGREAHAAQGADLAAGAAKKMAEAVPPTPTASDAPKAPASAKLSSASSSDSSLHLYNPNHGPDGRFISGSGGGVSGLIETKVMGGLTFHKMGNATIVEKNPMLAPAEIATIGSQLADLKGRYPTSFDVGVKAMSGIEAQAAAGRLNRPDLGQASGWVDRTNEPSVINLNVERIRNLYGTTPQPGWLMPTRAKADPMTYFVTHEYGHSLDASQARKSGMKPHHAKKVALFTNDDVKSALSNYGRYNANEGYAEAFAEWALTGGRTSNLAAMSYAEVFGWGQ